VTGEVDDDSTLGAGVEVDVSVSAAVSSEDEPAYMPMLLSELDGLENVDESEYVPVSSALEKVVTSWDVVKPLRYFLKNFLTHQSRSISVFFILLN